MPATTPRPPDRDGTRLVHHLRPDPRQPSTPGVVAATVRPDGGLRPGISYPAIKQVLFNARKINEIVDWQKADHRSKLSRFFALDGGALT